MKKFWTDAKIAEKIEEIKEQGLVVKTQSEKRPRNYITNHSLSQLVSNRNGFVYDNVREVIDDFTDIIWEEVLKGNRVFIPKIGSFFLTIKSPYKTNINLVGLGGKLKEHYVAPRYELRFFRAEESLFFLKEREVTEEELRRSYKEVGEKVTSSKEKELEVTSTKIKERRMK